MARGTKVEYIRFVDGSAAKKLQFAPIPFKKADLPVQHKVKRKCVYIDPVAVFGIFVAVCMFVMITVGLVRFSVTQSKCRRMEEYLQYLQEENAQLEQTYLESYETAEVEKTAFALGMVPQDRAYVVSVQLPQEDIPQSVTLWEKIGTFLTSLFA